MLKTTDKYPSFSEIDFIELYCAVNVQNGFSCIMDHHELEKKLYQFYFVPEFKELFLDICPKKDNINPENSYLDLGIALQIARLFGLLVPIHGSGETRSLISCNKKSAEEIITKADPKMASKMNKLFCAMADQFCYLVNENIQFSDNEPIVDKEKDPQLIKK